MTPYAIHHLVGIKARPEDVYAALTDPKKLAKWWTSDTRGESKVGGQLEFWFGDFCQKFRVTELKPNQLVRWKAAEDGMDEWAPTEIAFSLEAEDGQCMVRFTHAGWREATPMLAHCSTKWAVFMLSLKDLLETGKGRPAPDDVQIDHN